VTDSLLVGLMSGTSVDAIDAALVRTNGVSLQLIDSLEYPISAAVKSEISRLSHPGSNEIERMGTLDRQLGQLFAEACLALLRKADIEHQQVRAIGCHGQTIRHLPPSAIGSSEAAFTVQIGDPNTIAEITGITTVADFRRRDMAAGGEGAPLAPAFHAAVFNSPQKKRAIINIGGIANLSLLCGNQVTGFDSGPGNTLMDHWIHANRGDHYDADGAWAASGSVNEHLLNRLLQHPYLQLAPPKSTGKEAFNLAWLQQQTQNLSALPAEDVQATLTEFTARTITDALASSGQEVDEIYVCGGGAANADLMARIRGKVSPVHLGTTTELGCDPGWVEAAAFAWLAYRRLEGLSGNITAVTGASAERILGGVYSA
jgi:anhydro-N-acetylmuramic acid kinase